MRNGLASDVLNSEMLYLMKLYQGTLDNLARLASTVKLLENTSILVNIFWINDQKQTSKTTG